MIRSEIVSNINDRVQESGVDDMIKDLINQVLMEIQNPGWAFTPSRTHHHLWNFNRRKTTFSTVADQEDYRLPRDMESIGLIRQTTSPNKLIQVDDQTFFRLIPNPTAKGNPFYYRLWEDVGLATALSTDDTITIVSDSTSDITSYYVSITGYETANGIRTSEQLTLNGTTNVNGSITFKANKRIVISKSRTTNGTITIKETTSGTTLLTLGPQDQSPRFKVMGMYPIPSAAITMYLEYFTRIRLLYTDTDSPDFDEVWHYVVEQGVLSKMYEYKQDAQRQAVALGIYKQGVLGMIEADKANYDNIPYLRSMAESRMRRGPVKLGDEAASGSYGTPFGLIS